MDSLSELAVKYGADKWGKHHYTPIYYDLFEYSQNQVMNVLEIGIAEGASLNMWRDFFPNAIIYGVDNDKDRIEKINALHRENGVIRGPIIALYGDQEDPKSIYQHFSSTIGEFDLIIDDGSHIPNHQTNTCIALLPLLSRKGIYVIEDVGNIVVFEEIEDALRDLKFSCIKKKVGKRYDDQLIIIKNNISLEITDIFPRIRGKNYG